MAKFKLDVRVRGKPGTDRFGERWAPGNWERTVYGVRVICCKRAGVMVTHTWRDEAWQRRKGARGGRGSEPENQQDTRLAQMLAKTTCQFSPPSLTVLDQPKPHNF